MKTSADSVVMCVCVCVPKAIVNKYTQGNLVLYISKSTRKMVL